MRGLEDIHRENERAMHTHFGRVLASDAPFKLITYAGLNVTNVQRFDNEEDLLKAESYARSQHYITKRV